MSETTPSSGRYPPAPRARRATPVAATLVQGVSRTITIAGFPLSTWAFALRIWAAMMVALYAAFWLQIESASTAAVTVAILAQPTRGQAYQKAVYRVLATIIGVVASFVIAGLFPQSRSLFVIGFAAWLGLCVYVGGLLDGNRAYGAILSVETPAPIQSASLLHEITALRPDITALFVESSGGGARAAAARSAAVALVAEVRAAGALASLPANTLPSLRGALGEALADGLGKESRALQLRLQQHADVGYADPHAAVFARHALDLLIENRRAQDGIEDLQAGRHPQRRIQAPIYRSRRAAARNGLCAFLAVVISAILFSLGGWPFASLGLALVGLTIAFSANPPNPRAFATNIVIAMPIAALLAGVTEFLILDGVDQFPLLAIGMAPVVLAGALLSTSPNQQLASTAYLALIFFLVILAPANPQVYSPETYLFSSFMAITSVVLLFVVLWTVLPTSDALRRRWYLTSARAEMRNLLAGGQSRRLDDEALFRDADRVGQLAALQPAADA